MYEDDSPYSYYAERFGSPNYFRRRMIEAEEFEVHAREAVEVLEDLLAHEREAGEGWKLAAADYYGKTLELKAKNRELTSAIQTPRQNISEVFYLQQEQDAHGRTKAALRDAEAKIKELHEANAALDADRDRLEADYKKLHERIYQPDWGYEVRVNRQAATIRQERARGDDYADRLKATNETYRLLSIENDYHKERATKWRERIKTYRATLEDIAKNAAGYGRNLAFHVLNSDIQDGGADF